MIDLADFLLARIAEDEAAALAEAERRRAQALATVQAVGIAHIEFGGAFDPARVLADCKAKRQIVAIHQDSNADLLAATRQWDPDTDLLSYCARCEVEHDGERWPCETLRALALPYASHPDYRDLI